MREQNKNRISLMPAGFKFRTWRRCIQLLMAFTMPVILSGCHLFEDEDKDTIDFPALQVPAGFKVEKVVGGLNFPTTVTWDDAGNMYVVEAGGGLAPEKLAPMRIMQVKNGMATQAVDLTNAGINPAVVGMTWHDGAFYITHRGDDLTGAVSRVTKSGQVETILQGIIDSQAEHQINDIRMGPDGRMYVAVGMAGNAAVMDQSVAPFIMRSPNVHATPCQDIVLKGRNFKTADFRTEDANDSVMTGAYVPFGVETEPGQVIKGVKLCGGSILSFNPTDPMGTIETHAWGFRNLIGLAWDKTTGAMYAAENGYDIRGARPVKDYMDASLRIQKGKWYGVPDFSAERKPLDWELFEVPDRFQAMVYVNGEPVGKDLDFVIDHQASGLTPPDPSMVLGKHEFNSSPSLLDVAPASWGDMAGKVFIAEWGDLAPPTNPLRGKEPAGFQVVMVDPATGNLKPFAHNLLPGSASSQGNKGKGLERPFGVRFGPDDAMYIVDYGVFEVDLNKEGSPYVPHPGTGIIWKVSKK